jgi:hypothetical protein
MSRMPESVLHRVGGAALIVISLPILLPLVLFVLTLYWVHQIALHVLVWLLWLPRGKDVLFVYSNSPIWREYMTTQVLPLLNDRAIVLNWSDRKQWSRWSFAAHVFRTVGRGTDFNPIVAVFRPLRRARVFRFWSAFKYWKHGDTEPVEQLRKDLLDVLQVAGDRSPYPQ